MAMNTSISLPEEMVEEIEARRHKGTNRSEWVREAIQARIDAEDRGDWDDVQDPMTRPAD